MAHRDVCRGRDPQLADLLVFAQQVALGNRLGDRGQRHLFAITPHIELQRFAGVEDDDSLRRALQRLLRSVGCEVEAFATAEEFLERPQMSPACLILDQHLPGLSGLELQARLKADNRAVAVVFISAYAEEQVRRQALAAGAIAFLQKPFEEHALLNVVGGALGTDPVRGGNHVDQA